MTDDDAPYWPHGFAELDEIADTDELDTQRLDAMYERVAEEATAPLIENPSRTLSQERGQMAAAGRQDEKFEALIRLHGRGILTALEVLVLLRSRDGDQQL